MPERAIPLSPAKAAFLQRAVQATADAQQAAQANDHQARVIFAAYLIGEASPNAELIRIDTEAGVLYVREPDPVPDAS